MKVYTLSILMAVISVSAFAQSGHIMQGVGATNMSMGGASTAQPLDISGTIHWNPAALSVFDQKIIKLDVGLFFSVAIHLLFTAGRIRRTRLPCPGRDHR